MNERILFVDDDPNILEAYQRKLQRVLAVETALGGEEGLRTLEDRGPFAVVVADMQMPQMDGIEFLSQVKERYPETVRMMLTGNADTQVAIQAVNEGNIFRFLTKPCPADIFGKALVAGLNQYRLICAEKELLEGTVSGVVELLAEVLSWVDPEAFGRTMQLRNYVKTIAALLHRKDLNEIQLAATLSQIGYMGIPHDILARTYSGQELSEDERQALRTVPSLGRELVARIPRLEQVAQIIFYQNKGFDGSGYPEDTVSGNEIPMGSRILKVALDLLDLEHQGRTRGESIGEMRKHDVRYDPRVFYAAIEAFGKTEHAEGAAEFITMPLRLGELRAGLTLACPIETMDARLLVRSGTIITETLLLRIKQFSELVSIKEPVMVRLPAH